MTELLIFVCQFCAVFLLGLQSLMVRDNNKIGAAINSYLIGTTQFYLYSVIGQIGAGNIGSSSWWAFVIAAPIAIVFSMYAHPIINKAVFNK